MRELKYRQNDQVVKSSTDGNTSGWKFEENNLQSWSISPQIPELI